jgi:hypothetical protein
MTCPAQGERKTLLPEDRSCGADRLVVTGPACVSELRDRDRHPVSALHRENDNHMSVKAA